VTRSGRTSRGRGCGSHRLGATCTCGPTGDRPV
jgi:hypothetical protein